MRVPCPNADLVFHHPCHLWQSVRATPIYPTQTSIERRQSNAARDDHKMQFAMNPTQGRCSRQDRHWAVSINGVCWAFELVSGGQTPHFRQSQG